MNFKASALILPLLATLPLGGCFTSTYTHGHVVTTSMLNQVQVGSSREQVELVLGSPSTTSSLSGDAYYYISQENGDHGLSVTRYRRAARRCNLF